MTRVRFLAFLFVATILARSAEGCSCGKISVAESRRVYQRIFVGKVVEVDRKTPAVVMFGKSLMGKVSEFFGGEDYDPTGRDYGRRVKFNVTSTVKGAATKTLAVGTGFGNGDCGFPFEIGRTYLVYAYDSDEGLNVSICSRTGRVEARANDLVELLGST